MSSNENITKNRIHFKEMPEIDANASLEEKYNTVLSILAYLTNRTTVFNAAELVRAEKQDWCDKDIRVRHFERSTNASEIARQLLNTLREDMVTALESDAGGFLKEDAERRAEYMKRELGFTFEDAINAERKAINEKVENEEMEPYEASLQLARRAKELWSETYRGVTLDTDTGMENEAVEA